MRKHIGIITLLFGLSALAPAVAGPPKDWGFTDLNTAVVQAKQQNRPLFLLFGFETCTWCEYLYRRGLNDTDLRAQFQAGLVLAYHDTRAHSNDDPVTMPDGTTATHIELIKRFSAYPTPSWIYFSPSGQVLASNRNARTTSRELRYELQKALSSQAEK